MSGAVEPDDFAFWSENEDSVVIPEQQAVAVYSNRFGVIVIRQEAKGEPDDACVFVRPENAAAVAEAITRTARDLSREPGDVGK